MALSRLEFTQRQKMFLLSFISEVGAGVTSRNIGFVLKLTVQDLFDRFRADLGDWELIWGPAVYQTSPDGLPENVIYAARENPQGQVAITIAGTNPNSIFDWVMEDWHIEETVPWRGSKVPAGAAIAKGSSIALSILTALHPVKGSLGEGQSLLEFLTAYFKGERREIEVFTTGHSLGGAVSPLLALWLAENQAGWDPNGKATLGNFAFAGPTAGNRILADYAGKRLGGRINRIANDLDTSPLGWSVAGLERAKIVYQPAIPASEQVYESLSFRQLQAAGLDYAHCEPEASPLSGKINYKIISPFATPYENYQAQSHFQHLEAYFDLLNLTQYLSYQQLIRAALTPLAIGAYYPQYYRFLLARHARHLTKPK